VIQEGDAEASLVTAAVDKTLTAPGKSDVFVNNAGRALPRKFEDTALERNGAK
jgi:3-oxoacyl-[acyl-carrier protein] reductase